MLTLYDSMMDKIPVSGTSHLGERYREESIHGMGSFRSKNCCKEGNVGPPSSALLMLLLSYRTLSLVQGFSFPCKCCLWGPKLLEESPTSPSPTLAGPPVSPSGLWLEYVLGASPQHLCLSSSPFLRPDRSCCPSILVFFIFPFVSEHFPFPILALYPFI